MSRLRGALWAIAIGVVAVMLGTMLFRMIPGGAAAYAGLLVLSVMFVSALVGLLAEIAPSVGAGGGVFAAVLVAAVLAATIAVAPTEPGAHRPGLRDLFWLPLLGLVAALVVCGAAGWAGARLGLRTARRRKGGRS